MTTRADEPGRGAEHIPRIPFRHSVGRTSPVEIVRLSHLRELELSHSIYDPMRLEFHEVHFVTTGTGAHWIDFERVPLEAGDVLHLRPEQVHAFDADCDHEAFLLLFEPRALKEAHLHQPARWQVNSVLHPPSSDFGVLTGLLRVQEALDKQSTHMLPASVGLHLLAAVFAGLADVVSAQQGRVDPTSQRYEKLALEFEALLESQHTSSKSVAWYSSELNTTTRTLARACRHARDASPKEMIDLRVVLEAKRQLATTSKTVEAIGFSLGFTESTNFVKFFRRIVGSPPDAFRRARGG